MISIAHMINPVIADRSSDLFIAQPITFETMRAAKEFSKNQVNVNLYAIQYNNENHIPLPEEFLKTPDLNRSITDIKTFKQKRKLPLIKDILDALYETSSADYMIYTNVDIALQPYFYLTIFCIIQQGYDAFIINRRTIPEKYKIVEEIPLMYAEVGERHKGWDCFIFHRPLYPRFQLGNTIIGAGWFGRVMITNMACFTNRFKVFDDVHLTFHIGNEKSWQSRQFEDYLQHNKNECRNILTDFDKKYGPFNRNALPGRFLRLEEQ
jgi:hypothetical protein